MKKRRAMSDSMTLKKAEAEMRKYVAEELRKTTAQVRAIEEEIRRQIEQQEQRKAKR